MALVNSYQGFIFDYGGVLVHHQTEADQANLAELAGMPPDTFTELYWSDRMSYDKGLCTAAEYWQGIARAAGKSFSEQLIEQLIEFDTTSWMQFDSAMWDWVKQLRDAGKRLGMLSNMPRELGEALRLRTEKLKWFDQVTLSYAIHAAKPEPAAYEHCLEGLGTSAEETVFFDDRIVNIQAAEELGLRAIQFTNRDDFLLLVRT